MISLVVVGEGGVISSTGEHLPNGLRLVSVQLGLLQRLTFILPFPPLDL